MADAKRRNIWFHDELWTQVVRAAALETIATGKTVTASEWVRRACITVAHHADAKVSQGVSR